MKDFFSNKYVKFFIQAVLTAVGTFIMSTAFKVFYTPNGITPSGFSGLATIISYLFGTVDIQLSPSIIFILLNVVLFVIALFSFGIRFTCLTLVGVLTYSCFMDINPIPAFYSENLVLVAIMGGAIFGLGCGLLFRIGASSGGSDVVALALNKKFPKIKTGQCHLMINAIVLLLSLIVYKNLELTLYTVIGIVMGSIMTDKVLSGVKTVRAVYIICTQDDLIANKIMKRFNQGVTRIDVEGMYSQKNMKILLCLVSTYQAPFIKNMVTEIEPTAIVYSTSVNEAVGEKAFLKAQKQGLDLSKTKWKHLLHPKAKTKKCYTRMPHTKNTKGLKKQTFALKRNHNNQPDLDIPLDEEDM